ncbi:MAG TPA: response regulator transcription factor [Candidatus Dormibacteraeota bacterium]|nr:response regulator transcription factor [Candidatus Dormibacteraeota bacterium]
MARLVLIDDEPAILRALGIGLRARGHEVRTAATGEQGLAEVALAEPDVVVLDLGLPDMDGIEVCRRIREWSSVPIVVLSAHGAEDRKVAALDQGADDFVTKPFGMPELEARLRVAARHSQRLRQGPAPEPVVEVGPLRVDLLQRTVTAEGEAVELTPREFEMLAYLAQNVGRVLTHRMLLQHVWGPQYGDETHYLRVYANRLRRKLGPAAAVHLRTRAGIGYQMVLEVEGGGAARPARPLP